MDNGKLIPEIYRVDHQELFFGNSQLSLRNIF